MKYRSQGFSLIEMMIVVVIITILVAIVYPNYQQQVKKARRADAQAVLMEAALYMERFYTGNNRYDEDTVGGAVALPVALRQAPRDASTKHYDITVGAVSRSTYTLRASPKGAQAGNGYLEVTNTGLKSWDKDNSGAIASSEQTWLAN